MSLLRRLVLIRHGETRGESSVRFHGSSDVVLSDEGRAQMRAARRELRQQLFDLVVASPLRRSWESAWIVARGAPVRLESDLREVHFGRWEGLTREEIEASDPVLYADWQQGAADFAYPGGEARADFRERVGCGLARLQASGATSALVVVHKGPIRVIAEQLLGQSDPAAELALGAAVELTRRSDGSWFQGRRGSDPEALTA